MLQASKKQGAISGEILDPGRRLPSRERTKLSSCLVYNYCIPLLGRINILGMCILHSYFVILWGWFTKGKIQLQLQGQFNNFCLHMIGEWKSAELSLVLLCSGAKCTAYLPFVNQPLVCHELFFHTISCSFFFFCKTHDYTTKVLLLPCFYCKES